MTDRTYCYQCQRQFKSHMGLVAHWWGSYEHASPERKAKMDAKRAKKLPKQHTFARLIP